MGKKDLDRLLVMYKNYSFNKLFTIKRLFFWISTIINSFLIINSKKKIVFFICCRILLVWNISVFTIMSKRDLHIILFNEFKIDRN